MLNVRRSETLFIAIATSFLKPPSRDNHCKASYPRTQQCNQVAGLTQNGTFRPALSATLLGVISGPKQVALTPKASVTAVTIC